MLYLLVIIGAIFTQSDWVSGPGVQGPVLDWDKAFYQYDSVTYNIQEQISPVVEPGAVDYTAWEKHIIDSDADILNHSIWPADFDNDGDIDLAGWKGDDNQLVFYENDGSNTFTPVTTYAGPNIWGSSWGFIYGADLDSNGLTDVVVPGGIDGGLTWYQNNGGFSFTSHLISANDVYIFVYGADIDNDNDTDLVVSRAYEAPIEIWENNGTGIFTLGQTIQYESWRIKFADLNNDGWVDIVIGDGHTGLYNAETCFRVFLNDGTGKFNDQATTFADNWGNDALWIRDMDNDDDLDIICGVLDDPDSPTYIDVWWMENDGSGMGWTKHIVYHGGDLLFGDGGCAEDFDFDGLADVASGFQKLSWFRQINLDSFTEYQIDDPSSYTHWIYPMKLGGGTCFQSGNVDLLVCWQGEFAWYENQMVSEFAHGWLTSSILEIHNTQQRRLLWFGWEACVPAESTLAFYWRADSTAVGIGTKPWIGPHYSIVGEVIRDSIDLPSDPCYRYFQYKTEFWPDGDDAAVVHEVWLTETTCGATGVEKELKVESLELRVFPNPSFGNALIKYGLPEKAVMTLKLYDISGRLVKSLYSGVQEKGYYEVDIKQDELKGGIYFIRFETDKFKATRKLTIIR